LFGNEQLDFTGSPFKESDSCLGSAYIARNDHDHLQNKKRLRFLAETNGVG
jgi:hypothetical protein